VNKEEGMMRGMIVVMAAVVLTMAVAGPAAAADIGDGAHPFVYTTPLFTPKENSNSTLVFASADGESHVVKLRRYNAVGGLMSSTNVTLGGHSSMIAFAGANSGVQMHIEVWSRSPGVMLEVTYTDPGSAVQRIPAGDIRMIGPAEHTLAATAAQTLSAVQALSSPLETLTAKVGSVESDLGGVRSGVDGLGPKVDALGPKIDALQGGVSASDTGATGRLTTLAADNAKLRKSVGKLRKGVGRLRKELRALRGLIVKRLPKG
jgi:hypothetical protein